MTNAEAIGILALVVEAAKGRCFVTDEAISDAYGMAINALQAQEWMPVNKKSHPDTPERVQVQLDNEHGSLCRSRTEQKGGAGWSQYCM